MLKTKPASISQPQLGQMQQHYPQTGSHVVETIGSYSGFAGVIGGSLGGYWIYSQIQELKKQQTDMSTIVETKIVPVTNNHSQAMKDISEFIKKTNDRFIEMEIDIKKLKKDKKLLINKLHELDPKNNSNKNVRKSQSKKLKSKNNKHKRSDDSSELSQDFNNSSSQSSDSSDSSESSKKSKKKNKRNSKETQSKYKKDVTKKNTNKLQKKDKDGKKDLKKQHDEAFDD